MKTHIPRTPANRSSLPLWNLRNLMTPRCRRTCSRVDRAVANDPVRHRLIFDESPPLATLSDVTLCSTPKVESGKKSRPLVCSSADSGIQTLEAAGNVRTWFKVRICGKKNRSVKDTKRKNSTEEECRKRVMGSPKSVLKKKVRTSARTQGLLDCNDCNTPKSRNIREGISLPATDTITGFTPKHHYNLRKRKPVASLNYSRHEQSATDNEPPTSGPNLCAGTCDDSALGNDSLSDELSNFGI